NVREHDVVYRADTDEFCVLLLGAEPDEAAAVAERIVAAAREIELPDGSHVTVSVGLAAASSTDVTVILDDADRALAEAKAAGRGRCVPRRRSPAEHEPAVAVDEPDRAQRRRDRVGGRAAVDLAHLEGPLGAGAHEGSELFSPPDVVRSRREGDEVLRAAVEP